MTKKKSILKKIRKAEKKLSSLRAMIEIIDQDPILTEHQVLGNISVAILSILLKTK